MTQSPLSLIQHGTSKLPPRIMMYGLPGIGKSTFAANFPTPIFVQTEDGLRQVVCSKFPLAQNLGQVFEYLSALVREKNDFQTIVIDSLDWLEQLIWAAVCENEEVESIERIGYGKGYVFALGYWKQIVKILDQLNLQGKIILLLAHAVAEDYSDPEVSSLKRFTPRLYKTARSLLIEYADIVFFGTRKFGAARGDQDNPRVVRTETSPISVGKKRYNIPDELPLDARVVLDAIKQSQI